ncbi:hypothetical protein ASE14_03035 [Agromyces sp. Root81]|nr:hypothetical protein ASE14_03035 [Agromyces sp. Root81]
MGPFWISAPFHSDPQRIASDDEGGLIEVFDERGNESGGVVRSGAGRGQVRGAVAAKERFGVEPLAVAGGDGVEYAGVGEGAEGEGHALPDRVAGAGVGFEYGLERVAPPGGGGGVAEKDRDGVVGCGGVEGPTVELGGWAVVECCGVEEGLECGAGLGFPEAAAVDPTSGESGGADHRSERVLAATDR